MTIVLVAGVDSTMLASITSQRSEHIRYTALAGAFVVRAFLPLVLHMIGALLR